MVKEYDYEDSTEMIKDYVHSNRDEYDKLNLSSMALTEELSKIPDDDIVEFLDQVFEDSVKNN